MSVEETKRELLEGHDAGIGLHLDCGDYLNPSCADCAAGLDRLILEVQADMPCQRAEWGEVVEECTSEDVREREKPPISLCVSCLARAKGTASEPEVTA